MTLLASDLHYVRAERSTDLDDAGGFPSNDEILDNIDNNLFPDVASGDRIGGRTHLRKFFCGVRSPNTDVYMASRAYLSSPPSDPATSVSLLVTGSYSDDREDAEEALYTAAQQNLNTNLRLYQNYYIGETQITVYYFSDQTASFIGSWADMQAGDIIVLVDSGNNAEQYVRITSITVAPLVGDYQSASITFTPALTADFRGSYSDSTSYVTPTQIYTTRSVPMAYGIYSISPLGLAATAGDTSVVVESIETPIAPTITEIAESVYIPSSGGATVPLSQSVAAVDSRFQSATLSPAPANALGITATCLRMATGYQTIVGTSGLITLVGGVATADFGTSPFEDIQETHVPPAQTTVNITSETFTFGLALKPGTVAITAVVAATGVVVVTLDDEAGAFLGSDITGTIDYDTGETALTFAAAVRRESVFIEYIYEVATTRTLGGSASAQITVVNNYLASPVKESSLTWTATRYSDGVALSGSDDGLGAITGTGLTSGAITYSNGAITLTFTAPIFQASLQIRYRYYRTTSWQWNASDQPISSYTATLTIPVTVGSLSVRALRTEDNVTLTAVADGDGDIAGTGITGTINEATGALSLTFADPITRSSLSVYYEVIRAYSLITWNWGSATTQTDFVFSLAAERGIVPGSLDIVGQTAAPATLNASDDGLGVLTGDADGTIDYATGELVISFDTAVVPESIQVSFQKSIISSVNGVIGGTLEVVRLPESKAYPWVRLGDMVVVHHSESETLVNPVVAGTTYTLNRDDVDLIWLEDSSGTRIPTSQYTVNLAAGSVAMAAVLDLANYTQPLTAWTTVLDEALAVSVTSNSRRVQLSAALTHDYAAGVSYLSSSVPIGDLQATCSVPFAQQAWTSVWQNTIIGTPITAQYNNLVYPIEVTNDGAVTERWRIQFTAATTVNVIGEVLGQIATALSINTDIAPINPHTGEPYFTIDSAGWGAGWVNGNLLRFNTTAADYPLWGIRCIQPSVQAPGTDDRFRLAFLGDVDV